MKILLLIVCSLFGTVNALELNNNQTISFALDGSSLSSDIFIDIPSTATTLKIEIENGVSTSDFDLFMKFGSDFTASSFNDINAQADYSSVGADADEFFTISTALNIPLKKGKWYIAAFNFGSVTESINLTARYDNLPLSTPIIEFIFDQSTIIGSSDPCDIAGWNDTTPFTLVDGNNATTLGQARKNAVLKAAELMTENLQSTVPLIIQGCWPTDLETSDTSANLANAGARTLVINTSGLIEDTWYPLSIAERQAGTQACKLGFTGSCDAHSILINFNPLIDTDAGLGNTRWYYGLNNASSSNDPDFVSVALHEMTHGLGFSSAIFLGDEDGEDSTITCPGNQQVLHTIGTFLCNNNDIFSSFLVKHNDDNTITPLIELASDSQRASVVTQPGKLLWNSAQVTNHPLNTLSNFGLGLAQLYSPTELSAGSSVSHFSRSFTELMEPFQDANLRTLGLATPVLWDIGWDPRPKSPNVFPGLYHDPSRSGHGFVIEPIVRDDLFYTVFYTYKSDGTPEWFASLSTLENNVLNINMDDNELYQFIYDYEFDPSVSIQPHSINTSVGESNLKIDFNSSIVSTHAACAGRTGDSALASWQIGNQEGQWCIEPLAVAIGAPPSENDLGGTWHAGFDGSTDSGWGLSLTFTENDVIVVTAYYYDAEGNPRWVQGSQGGFTLGEEISIDMREFTGFARDAATIPLTHVSAGSLSITLNGQGTDGTLDMDVTYQGSEGGTWSRSNLPLRILTTEHQ